MMLVICYTPWFHGKSMNVLSSVAIKKYGLPCAAFQETQKFSTALHPELLHLTSPKLVNVRTESTALTQPIFRNPTVT